MLELALAVALIGTFNATGTEKGRIVLRPDGTLSGKLGDTTLEGKLRDVAGVGSSSVYTLSEGGVGIAGHLSGDSSKPSPRTLEVSPDGKAILKDGDTVTARERLVRARFAICFHGGDFDGTALGAFDVYAKQVAGFLESEGYEAVDLKFADTWATVIKTLDGAVKEGRIYSRIVFVGHGGWDGPLLFNNVGADAQLSGQMNQDQFAQLTDALKRASAPEGRIYVSACHAGGSNKFETDMGDYRWSDDVAKRTGLVVAGPMGETSTEYSLRLVKALEGQGTTVQETRWSSPRGDHTIPPDGTVSQP